VKQPVMLARFAACVGTDPELFFPPPGVPAAAAKQVCAGCLVRQLCLEWAVETEQRFGVWGGMSPVERQVVKRGRTERMVAEWLARQETVA